MITCIIAEKPSVARDIARIVGANTRQDGYLEGNGYNDKYVRIRSMYQTQQH